MSPHQLRTDDPARAAAWLLAEYDSTDIDDLTTSLVPVNDQPIFTLKSVMDPGSSMRVIACDYQDPDGYCL